MNLRRLSVRAAATLGAAAYLLVPVLAYAQTAVINVDTFEPTERDMTRWIIGSIFGNWTTGEKVPMLGAAMEVLNMFALAFGTLMFTYVAVIGTLNTAQDGELLGRKWSSMWIPLRFTLGTALLVPLGSGYSTIQHFILWLAMAGGGAASMVWGAAVENFAGTSTDAVVQSQDYAAKAQRLMRDILKAEFCVAALQKQDTTGTQFGISESIFDERLAAPSTGGASTYFLTFKWGATQPGNLSGRPADYCGSAKTNTFATDPSGNFQLASTTAGPGAMFSGKMYANDSLGKTDAERAASTARGRALIQAQAQGVRAAASQMRDVAGRIAAGTASHADIRKAITDASLTYEAIVRAPMQAASAGFNQDMAAFTNASKEAGWLMAGSTFFQMAQIRSAASHVMESLPIASAGAAVAEDSVPSPVDLNLTADLESMEATVDSEFKGDKGDWRNPGEWIALAIGQFLTVDPSAPKHSLVQIKDAGDHIIVATETVAAGMVWAATAGVAATKSAAGWMVSKMGVPAEAAIEVFKMTLPAVYAGFIAAFGVGITMAFIIPMLPFVLTVGSIVGWLMALFSAVVAGPVWLAGHLHPEGDDIAGKGVGGYMILLETVTRPIFIVFGLIGAFLIMDPVLKLVALLFKANMSSVQGNSVTGVVSIVVLAMLYASIVFTTVRSTMSLTHVLSETVYRWIGGAHAGMEQAREFHGQAQGSAAAATGGLQKAGAAAAAARMKRLKLKGDDPDAPAGGETGDV